jgi:hypothetical protein
MDICSNWRVSSIAKGFFSSVSGNFAIMGALILPVLVVAAGGAIDVANAFAKKKDLQERLDSGVLSAAPQPAHSERQKRVEQFMALGSAGGVEGTQIAGGASDEFIAGSGGLQVISNDDGSVTANYSVGFRPTFLTMIGMKQMTLSLSSTAFAEPKTASNGCIYSLGNTAQNVLINSGASVKSDKCAVNVHSTSNPAFIMNAGSKIETRKFCVKGTKSIENGGTITNLQKGCTPDPDPWVGKIAVPVVPQTCASNGPHDGQTIKLKPGKHCNANMNGSGGTITFEPGLHILDQTMIIRSGATVIAEGVTFYFANTGIELRMNGDVTTKMTAPKSGLYKGILMFENPTKSNGTQPFIFNGSKGEVLEGVIHLPNRDVTYNSTTNQVSKLQLIVHSLIINSANWKIEPYDGGGSGKSSVARLVR